MRINGILVLLWATLSTVTLAGPEARRFREPDVTRLLPIRYDGYKYGYSPVGGAGNIKSWDGEYPSRYGGEHSSIRYDRHDEEHVGGKGHTKREYDLEYLEEELTKAFLDRHGKSRQEYGDRREEHHRDERFTVGGLHGSEYGSRGEHHGSSVNHGAGKGPGSGHESGGEHLGISEVPGNGQTSRGGHLEGSKGHSSGGEHLKHFGGHANGGGDIASSVGHSSVGRHTSILEKSHQFGGHSNGGGNVESSAGPLIGGHGGGHQENHGTETGGEHSGTQNHEPSIRGEHHGRESSIFRDRYRDRHEDRYEGRYGGRDGGRYGDIQEHHLLRDRLPYGNEHGALIGGFINAGRHKDYKGNYEEREENYEHKGLEKGLGFFAHKDTSDEHLQLKSYYLKGDSPESYEYNPYRSYRPYDYRRRYEHSSEESKEYYGYKGIYFGSKERTGFIRDYVKSKGSEEKSKSKGSEEKSKSKGIDDKSKSKSLGKAKGITEEYQKFVKDILKDLEKGLGIKSKGKGDDKGEKAKADKGEEKGKGNKNGLFGGDLVNVIKVTFGHEEKKSEKKSERRRRSTTRYARKFLDSPAI